MSITTVDRDLGKKHISNFSSVIDFMQFMPRSLSRHATAETPASRATLAEAQEIIRRQEERIRQLEDLAMTDELTGVLNRRGFMATLQHEIAYAQRDPSANGALVMVDLDRFKTINDTWGHQAGDSYLQAAVRALCGSIRSNDYAARLGGDEFAVILTRIDVADTMLRAAEIDRDFNCQITEWEGEALPLRGSFGVSLFHGARTVEDVMAEADAKLYAHKTARREKSMVRGA